MEKSRILKLISSLSVVDPADIKEEDSLAGIGIDSLKKVELIIALENEFHVTFDDGELDPSQITQVGNVINLVERYVNV